MQNKNRSPRRETDDDVDFVFEENAILMIRTGNTVDTKAWNICNIGRTMNKEVRTIVLLCIEINLLV